MILAEEPPLYEGLPSLISGPILETEGPLELGYLRFEPIAVEETGRGRSTPFSQFGIQFTPPTPIREVFGDDHWVFLPEKTAILEKVIPTKEEPLPKTVWIYPEGTLLIHRIYLKAVIEQASTLTSPHSQTLFEVRVMKKQSGNTWAFGLYQSSKDPKIFTLQQKPSKKIQFVVHTPHQKVTVQLERVRPNSCRSCHSLPNHSHHSDLYANEDEAGPCGFGPRNPSLKTHWMKEFSEKLGYSPIQEGFQ